MPSTVCVSSQTLPPLSLIDMISPFTQEETRVSEVRWLAQAQGYWVGGAGVQVSPHSFFKIEKLWMVRLLKGNSLPLVEDILCTRECLAALLASAYLMPVAPLKWWQSKNVCRHCQMSPGRQNHHLLRTTAILITKQPHPLPFVNSWLSRVTHVSTFYLLTSSWTHSDHKRPLKTVPSLKY